MDQSIIQLVDALPADNITVKVLKALDYVAPNQWNNLVGFDQSIRSITGETDAKVIQAIRDRAVVLYHDPKQGYQTAVKLYQITDKADTAMAMAALANKVGEKISLLGFLGNITPKADVTQSIDLVLKIAAEIVAYCHLNGIPQPNPQAFATALANNYQDAALMRMVGLACLDGILPLGPDFLSKIQTTIAGIDASVVSQNPVFAAVNNFLPGNNPTEKLGFVSQGFNAVQGWMTSLIAKTGVTPQSILASLGNFIQIADDNLDFVAAFVDQTTNYYEHTGIQTVARHLILKAHALVKAELPAAQPQTNGSAVKADIFDTTACTVGQTVEVWDEDDEDWYQATIEKIKESQFFVHYVGYGSSDDEWVHTDDVRTRNSDASDENGYAINQKIKVWDDDEEEWYSAVIQKIERNQYFVHYAGYDASQDEWVDREEIS